MTVKTLAASVIVQNSDATWDNRTTSDTNTVQIWERTVAGSADPAVVSSPSVAGMYNNDLVVGVY